MTRRAAAFILIQNAGGTTGERVHKNNSWAFSNWFFSWRIKSPEPLRIFPYVVFYVESFGANQNCWKYDLNITLSDRIIYIYQLFYFWTCNIIFAMLLLSYLLAIFVFLNTFILNNFALQLHMSQMQIPIVV